jgi:hypothetical protein
MSNPQTQARMNTWIAASRDEWPRLQTPFMNGQRVITTRGTWRIEMLPVGFDHSQDHVIVIFAVNLSTTLKGIPANGLE